MRSASSREHLSAKKIALLHVARRQLGLDEETYRDILQQWGGGVSSAADLDEAGFLGVVYRLEQLGFRSARMTKNFGHRHPSMATAAQVGLIRDLWRKYAPDDTAETGLTVWLSKYHHVAALRFVSAEKASKIIPALKAMVARL